MRLFSLHCSFFLLFVTQTVFAQGPILVSDFKQGRISPATLEYRDGILPLPFASDKSSDRVYLDVDFEADFTVTNKIALTLNIADPEAIGFLTVYFRSGAGWYRYETSALVAGTQTLEFSAANFKFEGAPAGLNQIEGVRLSFWRGDAVDSQVMPMTLTAEAAPILVLLPEDTSAEPGARRTAERFVRMCDNAGVNIGGIEQKEFREQLFRNTFAVVLPLNPNLSEETTNLLLKYVNQGGKLIAFYHLPATLSEALGFENMKHLRSPEGDAAFDEIRFENNFFGEVCPAAIRQASWNVNELHPKENDPNRPRVAAYWYDKSGRNTKVPAVLHSDRGVFFSHILLDHDPENTRKFLMSLFATYDTTLWHRTVLNRYEKLFTIGRLPGTKDVTSSTDRAHWNLNEETVKELLQIGRGIGQVIYQPRATAAVFLSHEIRPSLPQLYLRIEAMHEILTQAYVRSLPSKPDEFRAWWEHAGTGAYPGDWERTMKEISETGFNAVLPNMLWGGLAHYESDVLPRSETFRKYGDQIAQAVAAGKKYGIDVHVWKVNYNCSNAPKDFLEKMKQEGRLQQKADGTSDPWLCPSHPLNRELEAAAMLEVAEKYDVAGIHYDYIRYPNTETCFCNGCRTRFSEHLAEKRLGTLEHWPESCVDGKWREEYDRWRCDQITFLVEDVHRKVKQKNLDVKISAAVFPQYPSCKRWVLQDWPLWVEKGYLDFICPMNYTESPNQFSGMTKLQIELVDKRVPIYPGIGATATNIALSPEEVAMQIELARRLGLDGFTIFNLDRRTIQRIPPVLATGPTAPEVRPYSIPMPKREK